MFICLDDRSMFLVGKIISTRHISTYVFNETGNKKTKSRKKRSKQKTKSNEKQEVIEKRV
jgi:hypothetical protein